MNQYTKVPLHFIPKVYAVIDAEYHAVRYAGGSEQKAAVAFVPGTASGIGTCKESAIWAAKQNALRIKGKIL